MSILLVLNRRSGESIFIGSDIKVTILRVKGNQVRVGIDAPDGVEILREEVHRRQHGGAEEGD